MRYKGQGNPLAVLVACLTIGFFPQLLLIFLLISIPYWVYLIGAILWFMWWAYKVLDEE